MVEGQGKEEELPNAENDAPEQHGGTRTDEAGRTVPSAQDRALPYGPIPEVNKKHGHSRVRVVSVQIADKGTPVQELRQMEAVTEDTVGSDTKEDRKREEPIHDQRDVRGRAMHQSDPGFLENDEGGARVGPRGLPPDRRRWRRRKSERQVGGRTVSWRLLSLFQSLRVRLSSFLPSFFAFLSRDRPGGGRGSYRKPPADRERSRWTVNRKGLYIISS